MNERKKRERVLEAVQSQRGLSPAEVTELLDIREGRDVKNRNWDVQVGRLAFNGVDVDERIAAQKREEP